MKSTKPFKKALDAAVHDVYYRAFKHYSYNQSKAAESLGVSRGTFRTKMKQWGYLK